MPRQAARGAFRHNKAWYEEIQQAMPSPIPRIHASLRQISGCADGEKSYDGEHGNGILTEAVVNVPGEGRSNDHQSFFDAIHARMPKWQKPVMMTIGEPDDRFDAQRPLSIG